jgi:hypothetical protein
MEPKMTIATRVDQGGAAVKLPSEAGGRPRRTFRGIADRAERAETLPIPELPVWCIEA